MLLPFSLSAQSRLWRPEERVLLTDFSVIQAVAASATRLYAATAGGLVIYDRRFQQWEPPLTRLDGYPALPRTVLAALADPAEESVWFGLSDGWARYAPEVRRWESGLTGAPVRGLMFDAADPAAGIYLDVGGQWSFLPRGALVPLAGRPLPPPDRRLAPLDARLALERTPMADALRPILLTDPRLRSYRFTAAARSRERDELFLGTDGFGVIRLDLTTTVYERLTFGLLAPGTAAVAAVPGGAWAATSATSRPLASTALARAVRRGLTFVRADLSEFRTVEGPTVTGLGFSVGRRLLARGGSLWLATERGLIRLHDGGLRTTTYGFRDGLPDDDTYALAPAPDGVWVGTARGLGHVSDAGEASRVAAGFTDAVLSLVAVAETLWVGSRVGLGVLVPGGDRITAPPALESIPEFRAAIVSLARVGDTLVAATADYLGWRDPATGRWAVTRPLTPVGRIVTLAADQGGAADVAPAARPPGRPPAESGVWIAGSDGLVFRRFDGRAAPLLRVPQDLPGPIRDVAVDDTFLWIATDQGLVRLERRAALGL